MQHQRRKPKQGASKKNHGQMDSIRQAPRHRQVRTSIVRTSSNDIRRGNMGIHHPSKEQASSRTNKDGKKYVKHHIPGQKNKYQGKKKDKGHIRD